MPSVQSPRFILASASPARRQLLVSAGIAPFVCPSQFDEDQVPLSAPDTYVNTLARSKAETVVAQFPDSLILGCDSVLAFEGQIYGKPESREAAIARWQAMGGQVGQLYTGHALLPPQGETPLRTPLVRCAVTQVHFARLSLAEITAYVDSGEPLRCAGAFAIDGRGGLFIEKLDGCHSNVIGLSLPLLRTMLADLGYQVTDFWSG